MAVTSSAAKSVSSTMGMNISRRTSPFYDAWVDGSEHDYSAALGAIQQRDFDQLSHIAELNCLKMHGMMLTSTPTLAYWNAATVACMETVRELRNAGSRGAAVHEMMKGVRQVVLDLYTAGRLQGVACLGGAEGAVLGAHAMQALPVGVPKILATPSISWASTRSAGPYLIIWLRR